MDPRRDETEAEKYDRNWVELLQELRVTQTGVQILAGFLLTLPFTNRFGHLSVGYRVLFLVAFGLAAMSIALIIAPVSAHRFMFGRHEKDVLVHVSSGFAKVGLTALALTIVTVVVLIFAVVMGTTTGVVAGAVMLLVFVLVWVVLPLRLMRRRSS
ncbi:MAG: DUF6328 family protein [Marmoricola sp.]